MKEVSSLWTNPLLPRRASVKPSASLCFAVGEGGRKQFLPRGPRQQSKLCRLKLPKLWAQTKRFFSNVDSLEYLFTITILLSVH